MKAIVVISLEMEDAEQITAVLEHLDPPRIPHFDGQVRVAIDPVATAVVAWLMEDPPTHVLVDKTEHERLMRSDQELGLLEAAGVDNWEWYGEALRGEIE